MFYKYILTFSKICFTYLHQVWSGFYFSLINVWLYCLNDHSTITIIFMTMYALASNFLICEIRMLSLWYLSGSHHVELNIFAQLISHAVLMSWSDVKCYWEVHMNFLWIYSMNFLWIYSCYHFYVTIWTYWEVHMNFPWIYSYELPIDLLTSSHIPQENIST